MAQYCRVEQGETFFCHDCITYGMIGKLRKDQRWSHDDDDDDDENGIRQTERAFPLA